MYHDLEALLNGDAARSDVVNEADKPSGTSTVGFRNNSMSLDYQLGAGSVRILRLEWGSGCCVVCSVSTERYMI